MGKYTGLIGSCLKVHNLGIFTLLAIANFIFPLKPHCLGHWFVPRDFELTDLSTQCFDD